MGGFYDDEKFHQISFLPLNIGFFKFRIPEQKIRNPVRNKIPEKCSGISGTKFRKNAPEFPEPEFRTSLFGNREGTAFKL